MFLPFSFVAFTSDIKLTFGILYTKLADEVPLVS
jgi:hypothetical protein